MSATAKQRRFASAPGMLGLYLRAAAPLLPGASRLPGVPGGGHAVPRIELTLEDVEVERARLDAYRDVCGSAAEATLPPAFPHVLAFPLHMALMTDARFPFGPVGLVHIENAITQHRPLRPSDRLSFSVTATQLEAHPKGKAFSIITEARVRDELVWEERSTMLRRGRGDANAPGGAQRAAGGTASDGARAVAPATPSAEWQVPGDIGRRYAAVSGDRNPIHMHPLGARAFGFPRAIAHGMWANARCLAALELPAAFTTEVSFRKPVLVPAKVAFASADRDDAIDFALRAVDGDAIHLTGSVAQPRSIQ